MNIAIIFLDKKDFISTMVTTSIRFFTSLIFNYFPISACKLSNMPKPRWEQEWTRSRFIVLLVLVTLYPSEPAASRTLTEALGRDGDGNGFPPLAPSGLTHIEHQEVVTGCHRTCIAPISWNRGRRLCNTPTSLPTWELLLQKAIEDACLQWYC